MKKKNREKESGREFFRGKGAKRWGGGELREKKEKPEKRREDEKREKRDREGKGERGRGEEGFLEFVVVLIICLDEAAFMV